MPPGTGRRATPRQPEVVVQAESPVTGNRHAGFGGGRREDPARGLTRLPNTARDVCLLSINATLDGRLALYLSATGETVIARPGFAVLLAYNPGLVGATDIPDAWHSRFPATLEVTSHWAALAALGAPPALVREAAALDRQRIAGEDGLTWTPQFRDIESLWRMSERIGERAALAFFASNLHEQVQAGKLQDAEAAAACRMLDQAGHSRYRVRPSGGLANLHGYPRAVTG